VKIAVTGASGFVGSHLVKRLVKDNREITALSHHNSFHNNSYGSINIVRGSVEDVDSMISAFRGVDVVIHLVGIIVETKEKTFDKTVFQGTINLVSAAKITGVKKIIYLSALGTSSDAFSKYHKTKYNAEQEIINSGIEYTILRASVIFGEGDGFISMLSRMIKKSPITPVIGSGKYQLQPIYIDDLVQVIINSITNSDTKDKIIDIAGPEKLEYLQILNIIKVDLNVKRLNFHIPILVMKPMAFLMEKMLNSPPLTRDQLKMMLAGNTGNIDKMERIYSIKPISLEDGLKKYKRKINV
jgi:NADH dehydrogenase